MFCCCLIKGTFLKNRTLKQDWLLIPTWNGQDPVVLPDVDKMKPSKMTLLLFLPVPSSEL